MALLQESLLPVWRDPYHHSGTETAVCLHSVCHAAGGRARRREVLQQAHCRRTQAHCQMGQVGYELGAPFFMCFKCGALG